MVKTRIKKAVKPTTLRTESSQVSTARSLDESVQHPPHLFILPKDLADDARILTLPEWSASNKTTKLLLCPKNGFHEFTNVAEARACRSWLLTPDQSPQDADAPKQDGYVLKRPNLLIATPIDTVFVVLALMSASTESKDAFLSCSDYIFAADITGWQHLQQILRQGSFAGLLTRMETSMASISECMSLGDDDTLYRLSQRKVSDLLVKKAVKLSESGLPRSLEQRFICEALDVPTTRVERSEMAEEGAISIAQTDSVSQNVSQESASTTQSDSSASTAPTSVADTSSDSSTSPAVSRLLRIRTVWEYMLRSYVTKSLHQDLRNALSAHTQLDMKPLVEHEQKIVAMKQEVQALRTLSDNISRKRPVDDDEANAKQEEKRRKKEEEEQRKKNMSQGVKKLMKADTSGMKKLSSFFTKKTNK